MQLAYGWTKLTIKMNFVAVAVLVPMLFLVVPRYGGIGAAWVWVALNAGYLLLGIHFMHLRVLPSEKWRWYGRDVIAPALAAAATAVACRYYLPNRASTMIELLSCRSPPPASSLRPRWSVHWFVPLSERICSLPSSTHAPEAHSEVRKLAAHRHRRDSGLTEPRFIRQAIESVLAQTFTDFELSISDNASVDEQPRFAANLPQTTGGSSLLSRQEPRSFLEFGIRDGTATGGLLVWLAHDDALHRLYIEECVAYLDRNPRAVIVSGDFRIVDESGNQIDMEKLQTIRRISVGAAMEPILSLSNLLECGLCFLRDGQS